MLDINVGGEMIRVSRETFTHTKGTVLEALFSGRWDNQLQRDKKGCIFLDVNPTCFRCIIDHLKDCMTDPSFDNTSHLRVDDENQAFLEHTLRSLGFGDSFVDESNILTARKFISPVREFLRESDVPGKLRLLYRATRDGMEGSIFHEKCDNHYPTVTVLKTEEGYIFGGYTDAAWNAGTDPLLSEKSFLFSLYGCNQGSTPVKLPFKISPRSEQFGSARQGPSFGGSPDLGVYRNMTTVETSFLGDNYQLPQGWDRNSLMGSTSASLAEVEVFAIQSSPVAAKTEQNVQPFRKMLDAMNLEPLPETLRESLKAEMDALEETSAELVRLQDAFPNEKSLVQRFFRESGGEVALLNVSGRSITVSHKTLEKFPNSVFYKQFADPNWNRPTKKSKPGPVSGWAPEQVIEWIKTIDGLSSDTVSRHFADVTGSQLLALKREDIKDLGIDRPGSVALLVAEIEKLRTESEANAAVFIEDSAYCFGKIIDHMRLAAMADLGLPALAPPTIRAGYQQRFKNIVEYYFPTLEEASQFLPA